MRLESFDAAVSPCVLFGMGVLPIYQEMMEKIDITRRKMLRRIVGWVRIREEDWSITMKRMSERVSRALIQWPSKPWPERIYLMQWNYACRVRSLPCLSWVVLSCKWEPHRILDVSLGVLVSRPRGRLFLKWNAKLAGFNMAIFRCEWFRVVLNSDWLCKKDAYLRWCGVTPIPMRVPHRVPNASRNSLRHNVAHVPFFQVHNDNWW